MGGSPFVDDAWYGQTLPWGFETVSSPFKRDLLADFFEPHRLRNTNRYANTELHRRLKENQQQLNTRAKTKPTPTSNQLRNRELPAYSAQSTVVRPVIRQKRTLAQPTESDLASAATTIQSVWRGWNLRRTNPLDTLRRVAEARREARRVEKKVQDSKLLASLRTDKMARVRVWEEVMSLLLRLDGVSSSDTVIRAHRRDTVHRLTALQDRIDALAHEVVPDEVNGMEEAVEESSKDLDADDDKGVALASESKVSEGSGPGMQQHEQYEQQERDATRVATVVMSEGAQGFPTIQGSTPAARAVAPADDTPAPAMPEAPTAAEPPAPMAAAAAAAAEEALPAPAEQAGLQQSASLQRNTAETVAAPASSGMFTVPVEILEGSTAETAQHSSTWQQQQLKPAAAAAPAPIAVSNRSPKAASFSMRTPDIGIDTEGSAVGIDDVYRAAYGPPWGEYRQVPVYYGVPVNSAYGSRLGRYCMEGSGRPLQLIPAWWVPAW